MWFLVITSFIALLFTWKWLRNRQTVGNYRHRYVMITGCDSGFGNLLAKRLDDLGFHVFAGCFTQQGIDMLNKETSDTVQAIQLDVSKTESINSALVNVIASLPKDTGMWGLVNNAGIVGSPAPVEWLSREDYQETLAVNTFGMIEMCRVFLPLLLKANGRIINMSSIVGRIAMAPAPYTISKYAVEGYSDVLRRELYRRGVTVHIIEPGYFRTNIADPDTICNALTNKFNSLSTHMQIYYGKEYVEKAKKRIRTGINYVGSPRVHLVYEAYIHALTAKHPHHRYLVGNDAKLLFRILWNLPEWMSDYVLGQGRPIPAAVQT
ncbi:17-beta-hydroxysteroid dehydrogenase type 6-like [Mytilus californianus]|uniref:17-beta-hydroxysteroid dehydrogenase type 6-like n=1 Tax=Mytilus californianus TaxID=6549 RepID=UPI00224822A4|nr:17-beta-hydroxysteroid dehydrogenase type 6-like [Mytilus californianus]